MADPERGLISKALQTGDLALVQSRGIEVEHFADDECRDVFNYMSWFQRRHRETPSISIIKEEFPDFTIRLSKDPLTWHIDKFVNKVRQRKAIELGRHFNHALDDPTMIPEIELHALNMARQLTEVLPTPRAGRYSEMLKRIKEYERRAAKGEMYGTYMGIPTFDRLTLGMQQHELVIVVAYLSVGKSTLMQHIAYSCYLQGKTVLFISLEMEAEALLRRFDSMASHVKYHAMKALELEAGDLRQWEEIAKQADANKHESDIIIKDDVQNCNVDKVMAHTLRYRPDVVVVDYLELMKVPRSAGEGGGPWEKVQYSGQGLKQNARILRTTHVTGAQLNREGGKESKKGEVSLANVSFQSVGKDADILVGLAQSEDDEVENVMNAILLKNRDGRKDHCQLRWELENLDIGELGKDHRFPPRKGSKKVSRHDRQALMLARSSGGKANPWTARTQKGNPWKQRLSA